MTKLKLKLTKINFYKIKYLEELKKKLEQVKSYINGFWAILNNLVFTTYVHQPVNSRYYIDTGNL